MTPQEKINKLQTIEQNLQHLLQQRQQFQMQEMELTSALEELKKTKQAYKIVGNIMVASDKDSLEKDVAEKKERIGLRVKTVEKQEKKLKEEAQTLRKEVMESLNKKQ